MSKALEEKIVLEVDSSSIKANSLSGLLTELKAIDGAITGIHAKLGRGPTVNPQFIQPLNLIKEKLDKTFKTKGPYGTMDIAKAVGLDEASTNQILARLEKTKKAITGFQKSAGTFSSTSAAANAFKNAFTEELRAIEAAQKAYQTAIGKALSGQSGNIQASGKDVALKVEGQIGLVIPGTQIQASVSGPIELKVSGAQLAAADGVVPPGNNAPGSGEFTKGNTAGGTRGKKSKGGEAGGGMPGLTYGEAAGQVQRGELSKTFTETGPDDIRLAVKRVNAASETVTEIYDSAENLIKQVTHRTTGNSPLAQFRTEKTKILGGFKAAKDLLPLNDPGTGLAALYSKQASELRGLASPKHPMMAGLPAPVQALLAAQLGAGAGALDAKALQAINQMNAPGQAVLAHLNALPGGGMPPSNYQNWLEGDHWNRRSRMTPGEAAEQRSFWTKKSEAARKAAEREARRRAKLNEPPKNMGSEQWDAPPNVGGTSENIGNWGMSSAAGGAGGRSAGGDRPPAGGGRPPKSAPPSKIASAFNTGFGPENFAAHVIKFAGWAAAITAIYKPLELASYSLKRFMDVGAQTAHLGVVFRGVGGSAQQLADDVMKLAVANGRSTDEALESATEWARLGLNRVQINEAVRVSLEAANVAQISVGEATKQMSALMHIYGMNVGQLDTALGTLVNTSQKFNVTTEDLLGGLDRSAAAAKVAGVSFAELQGLIGATVGGTGQSGVQVGNTIKNLFTQFTRPEMQQYLSSQGISTMKAGQFGGGSEVLRQMFLKYQGMDPTQQRNLGTVVAGRLQVARFAGLMNEYPMAQKLAIDGQLRLNAAMETSVKIVQTLQAQMHGLGAEWDRLVTNSGSLAGVTGIARTGKNMIGLAADFFGAPKSSWAAEQAKNKYLDHVEDDTAPLSLARARAVALMTVSSAQWVLRGSGGAGLLPKVNLGPGLTDAFNRFRERGNEQRLSPDEQLAKDFRLHQGNMDAYERMSHNIFGTAADLGSNPSEASGTLRTMAADYLKQLGLPATTSYAAAAAAAHTKSVGEMEATMQTMISAKAGFDTDYERSDKGKEATKVHDDRMELLSRQTRILGEQSEMELSSIAEQINRKQEYVNLLKEQVGVMELITRLSSQVGVGTLGNESDNQLRSVTANIESLQAQRAAIEAQGSAIPVMDLEAYKAMGEQLREARGQKAMLESPRYQAAVNAYDDRKLATARASTEASGYAVGYTEAEKLLRQRAALEKQLQAIETKVAGGSATTNDLVRGWELQNQLASTHEKIQTRIVELKGQERQIIIDATREFQKSLLLAGPGELLKRLYVGGRGAAGGLNTTGSFMALDPESRRMYYDLRGGEAGAKNREEQWLFRGRGQTVEQQQGQAQQDRADVRKWGNRVPNPTAGMPGLPLPKDDPLMTQAYKSAQALSDFSKKLMEAGTAVDAFKAALGAGAAASSKPAPTAPPAPKLDVSAGHALGSVPAGPLRPTGAGFIYNHPVEGSAETAGWVAGGIINTALSFMGQEP